jgi:predicted PurR-regulated permease PerM
VRAVPWAAQPDRRGCEADLPLRLIFAGVIGGLLAFGLIGIFVRVLAVADTLLKAWIDAGPNAENASESQALTGE